MKQAEPGILRLDLHGKNVFQARVAIDAALRRAGGGVCRIRLVHGYHQGTAIRDMVRTEYGGGRVVRTAAISDGETDLVLREL